MFVTMITLLSTVLLIVKHCSAQCQGIGKNECCSGYEWNEKFGNCSKCIPGYFGLECRSHCIPPSYGEGCQLSCTQCSKEECHVSWGCPQCKPGYFGFNCASHCPYPSYGEGCQLSCTHCSPEECDVSWGCPRETTTRVLQKTSEFSRDETSALDYFSLQTTVRSRQYEHNSTFKELNTEGILSCFTKDVILILCSCGVGIVFLTLAIVFACKFARKKYISARKNVHISASDVYQQPIHYQEVKEIERLSADPASYNPLHQTVVNEQSISFNRSNKSEYSQQYRNDKYYNNVQLQRIASADMDPIPPSVYKSTATDTDGYEYPPFHDSTVNNEIPPMMPLGKQHFKIDSKIDKGSVYLTVIHNSD